MRQRRQVTTRAHASLARHDGCIPALDHPQQPLDDRRTHPAVPLAKSVDLEHEHESRDLLIHRLADADAVALQQLLLQARPVVGGDDRRAKRTETGVDAVARGVARGDRRDLVVRFLKPLRYAIGKYGRLLAAHDREGDFRGEMVVSVREVSGCHRLKATFHREAMKSSELA